MSAAALTSARVRELLDYDPATGDFTWKVSRAKARMGHKAGFVYGKGYIAISIDGRVYYAHRLAWLHATGEWPVGVIDHINHDKRDNRFANLRDTSVAGNGLNRQACGGNPVGIYFDEKRGTYQAQIKVDGRRLTRRFRHLPNALFWRDGVRRLAIKAELKGGTDV